MTFKRGDKETQIKQLQFLYKTPVVKPPYKNDKNHVRYKPFYKKI